MSIILRPYQEQIESGVFDTWQKPRADGQAGTVNTLAVAPTGAGKCLAKGTPVLLSNGKIIPVEDVRPGHMLANPYSKPNVVISITKGREKMIRVTPTKGEPYTVNSSHILSLKKTNVNHGLVLPDGTQVPIEQDLVNVEASVFHSANKTAKHVLKGWRSDVIDFTTVNDAERYLPAYVAGCWVGDGSKTDGVTAMTKPEGIVIDSWILWGKTLGCQVRKDSSGGKCPTWHLRTPRGKENACLNALRNAGMFDSWPSIPMHYKTSSVESRRQLLAGILDTDGSVSRSGWDFIAKHKKTSDDVAFVARSLGLAAYVTECKKSIKKTGFTGTYFRVSISGDSQSIPCRIKKPAERKMNKCVRRVGITTEELPEDDYFGFQLSGDKLFLLGDFTVTHNTAIMSSVVKKIQEPTVSIAHRQELVSQISVALARNEIHHRVIASDSVIRFCISRHVEEFGKNYHHDKAPDMVAGIQTLPRRKKDLSQILHQVKMWNGDEAHHFCPDNQWGKGVELLPNAFGLGVTASPLRADRKPLGRINGGLFDHMVVGPSMRDLITMGYLSEYRLIAPTMSIDRSQIPLSEATGELNQTKAREASHKSQIVGDIVDNYMKFAPGRRGIAFVVDIETAKETAERFNAAGIKAMAVSSKTPDKIRQDAIRRFSRGELKVLVNVDLFGEGFDVPAVEVVMMGRPTESFGLYLQQFGRALRIFDGKLYGIIIDHVGNWLRHGLPDAKRLWSLEADLRGTPRGKRDPDVMPLRRCSACFNAYEAITNKCPYCGHVEEPESRSGPEFVDGDLTELSPEYLAQLRGEISNIQHGRAAIPHNISDPVIIRAIENNFRKRQTAQQELHDTINLWAGIQTQVHDRTDSQAYRIFYHTFGTDVSSAQLMNTAEMMKLTDQIREGFH